jgi:hypothetical protein
VFATHDRQLDERLRRSVSWSSVRDRSAVIRESAEKASSHSGQLLADGRGGLK